MEQFEIESRYSVHTHLKEGIIDITAGTAGGIANVYAGQPLDTVKVKMQTFPHLYKSGSKCFKEILKLDGIRGLYAGTVPSLLANISENAVLFCAYGYCQKFVATLAGRSDIKDMTPVENAASGSLASIFAALVLCPTELVKCRLQAQRETNPNVRSSPYSISRDMLKKHGPRSFFVGMTPTLAREMPGYFFFFGAYEMSRYYLTPEGKTKDEIGIFRTAASGGIGGMALWTAIFPFDVVKSRMQIAGGGNFGSMILKIAKTEGIRAFYNGLAATLVRTCIASGFLFVAYEETKKILTDIFVQ